MNKPVRIAFCITDLDPGGAERALVQLVTRLDRDCWAPQVFCLSGPGELVQVLEDSGISVTCLGARRVSSLSVIWRLARLLRKQRPALLQTFLFHANIVGRIAGKCAGIQRIVSGIRVAEKRSRFRLMLDSATEWMVDTHVCVSAAVADFSVKRSRLSATKMHVIPNGVDADRFQAASPAELAEFSIPDDAFVFLFVGRLDQQKGPFDLLYAAKPTIANNATVHVLFVGEGPQGTDLKEWVRNEQLTDRIHFAGWRADVPELMTACDCLVLPSLWEGMPNVVLEAMAAGLPVVASDVEGVGELIENRQSGLLVSAGNVNELSRALAEILSDTDGRSKMAVTSQHQVSKEFTWEHVTQKYVTLYRSLLDG